MKLTVIIPAYNESEGVEQTAASVKSVLPQLRAKYELELLFINDGSKDNTEALLKAAFSDEPAARVISHEVNKGLGAAIRTGFSHATGDIVVTTDFDGTYPFPKIVPLLEQMERDKSDIVTASPYHPQGGVEGVPRYRLMFSFGASLLYRILVKWHIHTWTALFRAYKREVVQNAKFESTGFLAGTEILVHALRSGYTVTEFPTVLHTRTFGQSSIKIARVTWAHIKFQSSILWNDITSLPARLAGKKG
jgi:dolichol-phosphate mannosyltransferase